MGDRGAIRSTAIDVEHECRGTIYQCPTLASLLWFPGDPNVMRKRRGPRLWKKISVLISRADDRLITSYTDSLIFLLKTLVLYH